MVTEKEKGFFILRTSHEPKTHRSVALKFCSTQKKDISFDTADVLSPRKMQLS